MKGKSVKGVGYHCVWIFVSYVLLMLPFGTRVLCLMTILNTVSHFGIDLLKLKLGKIKYPTGYFFVDQVLHIIIICLTGSLSYTYVIRNRWMALSPRIEMSLIMFIICTYVSTIVIKQLYFSFGKLNFTKNPFFEQRERLLDALFCLGVILGWRLENGLGYLCLLIWTLIYFKVHKKMIIYDKRLLVTKAVFYLLFVRNDIDKCMEHFIDLFVHGSDIPVSCSAGIAFVRDGPCATIHDPETGRIAIYYGCADSYVGLAFTQFEDIVAYIKEHSKLTETDTEIGIR